MNHQVIDPGNIARAHTVIDPQFTGTPQFITPVPGCSMRLLLKVETINPLRSFKGRGTDFLTASEPGRRPLACASAGNFGQGLALAGARRAREVHVFTAQNVNPLKARRMQALGARLHITRKDFDGAKHVAQHAAAERGWLFVEDGADPRLAEGAGTIAAELDSTCWPDVIIAPVGNGSLINGLAAWSKHHHPETPVIAAGARGAPAMEHAWRTGDMTPGGPTSTIADGIAARVPVPAALTAMRRLVDEFHLVDDDTIIEAMRLLYVEHGLVSEPAGATAVAVALTLATRFAGALVATPVCGSNIDPTPFASYLTGTASAAGPLERDTLMRQD